MGDDMDLVAARVAGEQTARAAEIAELCLLAGRVGLTTELLRSEWSAPQVRRHLLHLVATEGPASAADLAGLSGVATGAQADPWAHRRLRVVS